MVASGRGLVFPMQMLGKLKKKTILVRNNWEDMKIIRHKRSLDDPLHKDVQIILIP